jgi:hypothetical protein
MRYLSILYFLTAIQFISAQVSFYKLYSGTGFDKGEDVLALPDSTYLVAGSSGSWDANAQGFLMKIDSVGTYLWSQAYGAQESEEVKRVFLRPGLGYYLAGISNSWSAGAFDPMLIYTDLTGAQNWIKTYPMDGWQRIHDGVQTLDTGFVLVGEHQASTGAEANVLLLRLDKNGDTLWTQNFGTTGPDRANSIIRISDTTYAVGGEWYVADSSAIKGFVFLLHDNGQILWFDTLGLASGEHVISDLTQTPFGIQFAGYRTLAANNHDKFSGVLGLNGQILAQNAPQDGAFLSDDMTQQITYIQSQDAVATAIQVQNQGTYPEPYDVNIGYSDALFGYWLGWPSTMILNQGYDYCGNIRPTLDGGFIAVGMNSVIGDAQNQLNGGGNVFVLKVNGNGTAYVQTDTVFSTQQLVGLTPIFEGSKVQVFPNPTTAELNFNWEGGIAKHVRIYTQWGSKVLDQFVTSQQFIDIIDWKPGFYFVEIDKRVYPLLKQ